MAITINVPPPPPEPTGPPVNMAISDRLRIIQREKELEALEAAKLPFSADHHLLVVDGKAKKVSKRSQYLIDMMTVDE
jgi:hypothetical protein